MIPPSISQVKESRLDEGVLPYSKIPTLNFSASAYAGVPVHVLRKIAGHGSLTTTQRYLHPDRQSIDAAGVALSAHL